MNVKKFEKLFQTDHNPPTSYDPKLRLILFILYSWLCLDIEKKNRSGHSSRDQK